MKLIAPEGYDSFTCIADRCQHTCCAGWEIDVDEDALAAYRQVQGPLGEKLAQEIRTSGGRHLLLSADGGGALCPFCGRIICAS